MLNPDAAGLTLPAYERSWSSDDAILYALAIGAGVDDLQYTTENTRGTPQEVLPTFGVVLATPKAALSQLGDYPLSSLVHARQTLQLHQPIPPSGSATVTERVVSLTDKGPGKHAIVVVAATATLPGGKPLADCEMTLLLRGQGGFGGQANPNPPAVHFPDREPDHATDQQTSLTQPLLYRLCGDRNPLHSDPQFAQKAGFERPILHGLCTYGIAGRTLLASVGGAKPERLRSMTGQFVSPVMPGEKVRTEIWTRPGGAVFRVRSVSDDRVVIDNGEVHVADT